MTRAPARRSTSWAWVNSTPVGTCRIVPSASPSIRRYGDSPRSGESAVDADGAGGCPGGGCAPRGAAQPVRASAMASAGSDARIPRLIVGLRISRRPERWKAAGSIRFGFGIPVAVGDAVLIEHVAHLLFHFPRRPPLGQGVRLRVIGRRVLRRRLRA